MQILPSSSSSSSSSSFKGDTHHADERGPILLHRGSRVRMRRLQNAAFTNGRTGTICADFNADKGRWTVNIDATASHPATQSSFHSENLEVLQGTEAAAAAVTRSMPYKSDVPSFRWKGAQGRGFVARVAVGSKGVDNIVVHTDHVRRWHHDTTRLWRWSGGLPAGGGVTSTATAWKRFCTSRPPV
jgi:hypothetical protein